MHNHALLLLIGINVFNLRRDVDFFAERPIGHGYNRASDLSISIERLSLVITQYNTTNLKILLLNPTLVS